MPDNSHNEKHRPQTPSPWLHLAAAQRRAPLLRRIPAVGNGRPVMQRLRAAESSRRLKPISVARILRHFVRQPSFAQPDSSVSQEVERIAVRYCALGTEWDDAVHDLRHLGDRSNDTLEVMGALGYDQCRLNGQFAARLNYNASRDAAARFAHPSSGLSSQLVMRGLHIAPPSEGLAPE